MFEIQWRPIRLGGVDRKERRYKCQWCNKEMDTLSGYKVNCMYCFRWNPIINDLMNSIYYRMKFHREFNERTGK